MTKDWAGHEVSSVVPTTVFAERHIGLAFQLPNLSVGLDTEFTEPKYTQTIAPAGGSAEVVGFGDGEDTVHTELDSVASPLGSKNNPDRAFVLGL